MKRFSTLSGESLGVTFSGDNGRTWHSTEEEECLLWSLDEDDLVLEDDGDFGMTVSDLMDWFFKKSHRATKVEMERRWKTDGSLGFKTGVSDDGDLFVMR